MVVPKKAYWLATAALCCTACLIYAHIIKASSPVGLRLAEFPMEIDEWNGHNVPYPDWLEESLGAEEFFIREYRNTDGDAVTLYVAYFDARYGGTTHNPDVCYPANGWEISRRSSHSVHLDGSTVTLSGRVVQKGFDKQLLLFYYQMGGGIMPELSTYRLAAIVRGILFNKIGGALVQISAPITQTFEDTYAVEASFQRVIGPLLREYLPE